MVDNVFDMVFINLDVARHLRFEDVEKIPHLCMLVQKYLDMYVIYYTKRIERATMQRKKKETRHDCTLSGLRVPF